MFESSCEVWSMKTVSIHMRQIPNLPIQKTKSHSKNGRGDLRAPYAGYGQPGCEEASPH
jgi:hypothetical protein